MYKKLIYFKTINIVNFASNGELILKSFCALYFRILCMRDLQLFSNFSLFWDFQCHRHSYCSKFRGEFTNISAQNITYRCKNFFGFSVMVKPSDKVSYRFPMFTVRSAIDSTNWHIHVKSLIPHGLLVISTLSYVL